LNLLQGTSKDVFQGNVSDFLRQEPEMFDAMRQDLLNWLFDRLSIQEKEVMYWLAINREPTSLIELKRGYLSPIAKTEVSSI
jgi:hypothetical protein